MLQLARDRIQALDDQQRSSESQDMIQSKVQCYPGYKNLGFWSKTLELCADVGSDVGIKAKTRLLRFL